MRPDESQDVARANVRAMLRNRRPARGGQKWLAHEANIGYNTLNHWLGGHQDMGAQTLGAIAKVFGVSVEHLFYNAPDEKAGAVVPPPGQEDWRESIREIERYVRSIEDPIERLATVRRLLAIARANVEDYERGVDRASAPGRAQAGDAPAPGVRPSRAGRAVK